MTGTLAATGLVKHHGARPILQDVSVVVAPSTRTGVVGPNGVGKSTLLRVLAGLEPPDAGTVTRAPASLTVGYLPQETDADGGETLRAYLARRTGVAAAEAEVDRLVARLASDPGLAQPYADALDTFVALGGDDLEARAHAVLGDLGLPADRMDVPVTGLSAGQAARAALAAILLSRFDVLLLDEPTNDLDFDGLERLESFLASAACGALVISHDRAFLDRMSRILEIAEPAHTATEFAGGWSDYVRGREIARTQGYAAYERYAAERGRLEERARTQRAWADAGVRKLKRKDRAKIDPKTRKARIHASENVAAKVKATERMLERLEAVDKPWEGWQLRMTLAAAPRGGDVVARLDGAVVRRGDFTLGPLSLEITAGERVAILGPNGSGKSTLLGALLGRLPLDAGDRYLGPGVVVGEMEQDRAAFAGDQTTLKVFVDRTGMTAGEARTLLAKFALGADEVLRPAASLSPGERTRAVLASLSARGSNCLVLDEPTNHLDLEAIEQLEAALEGFPGTILMVSHDRWLLERVRVTRTIRMG